MTRFFTTTTIRALASVAVLFFVLLGLVPAASAQAEEGVNINANFIDETTGERTPATGTVLVLLDADGAEVASTEIGDDGRAFLAAPGPGSYIVQLDERTLPEGVRLRNEGANELEITLQAGQTRGGIFALEQGEGGGGTGSRFLSDLISLSFSGLKFGLIIAMCSIGLSLIFGTTGLTNFAHGELVTVGALTTLFFNQSMHLIFAAILGVAFTAVFGLMNERTLWRPLRNRGTGLIAMLVISIGLSILMRYVILYLAGGNRRAYNNFGNQSPIDFGPLTFVQRDIFIMGIALASLVLVAFAVTYTRTGKAMRAVADNVDLAESSGIDVQRVIQTVWIGGAGLAGLGGVLFGLDQTNKWDMGFELLLLMFAAVTLGGLGTAYGPLIGSVLVGLLVNLSTITFPEWFPGIGGTGLPTELKNIGALFVLVGILLIRPQGILGRADRIG